jgi:hypothetical protein
LQGVVGNSVVRRLARGREGDAVAPAAGGEWVSAETIDGGWRAAHRRLDALLSALPRMRLEIAGRSLPAFKTTTISALLAALGVGWACSPLAGVPRVHWAAAWLATTLLLLGVLHLHRLINYAFQAVASIGFLAAGLVLPGSALAMLDVGAVALAVATGIGRIGCACAGCCHGRPAPIGLRYGVEHVRSTFPTRLAGVPLLPVQLIESAVCLALVPALLAAIPATPAGSVFVLWALAYAVLRWVTEGLRGDRRPRVMGVTQARWTSGAIAVGALALDVFGVLPGHPMGRLAATGLVAALAVEVGRWRAGRALPTMLGDFTSWDALASALHALTLEPSQDGLKAPPTATTPDGVRISLTRTGGAGGTCTTWGLSAPGIEGGEARIRRTAAEILGLRHPGATGTLMHGARGVSVLVVGGPDSAHPYHVNRGSR